MTMVIFLMASSALNTCSVGAMIRDAHLRCSDGFDFTVGIWIGAHPSFSVSVHLHCHIVFSVWRGGLPGQL